MDMVYRTNWIARTRRRAAWLVVWYALVMTPSALVTFQDQHRPVELAALGALALTPVLIARLCWRFLADAERRHPEPTPEMEFVFRLMTTILIGFGVVAFWVLAVV
ncbi:MAG: hypothetical protein IT177_07240 [Acidobacteria bacterium]|nr:hypothetical protein [Acidobacteriota bacterium]